MEKYKVILERTFIPVDVRALEYARKVHAGEKRHDGSPYINHPIRVAALATKYIKSKNVRLLKAVGYLHDTIENTNTTYNDLLRLFGPKIAYLVLELTTDEDLKNEIGKTRYLELKMKNMSELALAFKLCDRLDNLYDMNYSSKEFITRQVDSTVEIIFFLMNHRGLTITHIDLINDILERLFELNPTDEIKNAKLSNLINSLSTLKDSKEIYFSSLSRIKSQSDFK